MVKPLPVLQRPWNISTRWVKKLWARYRYTDPGRIIYPAPMGRPEGGIPGRREHSAVLTARTKDHLGAVTPATESSGTVPE